MSHPTTAHTDLVGMDAPALRHACRTGDYTGHTAGLASGRLQCNLVILPAPFADAFFDFCQANPQACPYIASTETGDPQIPILGKNIDLRSDLPGYCVYRQGKLADTTSDISDLWRDDLVSFAIGCSFTFEHALQAAGVPLRHVEEHKTVPMYQTNRPANAVTPFTGNLVMSMRPVPEQYIKLASDISSHYPQAHGGPMHSGDPAAIGIKDISHPEWGDAVTVGRNETLLFWGCGVTTQVAIQNAQLELCITHKPGAMLVTDLPENQTPEHVYQMR